MKYTVVDVRPFFDSQSNIQVRVDVKVGSKTLVLFSNEVDDSYFSVLLADGETDGYNGGHRDLMRLFRKPAEEMRILWNQLERVVGHAQGAVVDTVNKHKAEVLTATLASIDAY